MGVKPLKSLFVGVFLLTSVVCTAKTATSKVVDIQNWQTSNGARVFFVELHQLPIVDAELDFAAGSAFDANQLGIASLVGSMLDEGTATLDSDAIAEQFDSVGSQYRVGVGRDFSTIGFRSLSADKYLKPTVDVFTKVVTQPAFPQSSFDRVKRQTLVALQSQQQQPGAVANKLFFRTLYGNQGYGHPTLGTLESVQALQPVHLKRFYDQYYVSQNATVVLVGDLTRASAESLAEQMTRGLQRGRAAGMSPQREVVTKALHKNINFPSSQTHVIIGQIGIQKGAKNYFPALVGNFILGGGVLTSRLIKTIREDHGYAYSAASYFLTMREKGPFIIGLQTRTAEAKNAANLALDTLLRFVNNGPSSSEIRLAKNSLIQSFALNLASNRAIMSNVSVIATYRLPLNYLDTYRDKVRAVTANEIKNTFKDVIQSDKLVTITVGKMNG